MAPAPVPPGYSPNLLPLWKWLSATESLPVALMPATPEIRGDRSFAGGQESGKRLLRLDWKSVKRGMPQALPLSHRHSPKGALLADCRTRYRACAHLHERTPGPSANLISR